MLKNLSRALVLSRRGYTTSVARPLPQEASIGFHFNKRVREAPHRTLWRRKTGIEQSSWNQCKKSFEALATNFSNLEIGDRVLLIGDCDIQMVNVTLAIQKRGAHLCSVPIEGLTTKVLEQYIETLRPKMIFLNKDKVRVFDPLSKEAPLKMDLDLYGMIWKVFPVANVIEGLPLRSQRYSFVQQVVLCDQAEALNQHDMVTNIKYYETSREQDYYESPLVHLAMHTSPQSPALSLLCPVTKKWVTHTHTTLLRGGHLFGSTFFPNAGNERVVVLPGGQSSAWGYLVMYAVLARGATMCFAEDQLISAGDCRRATRSVFVHKATGVTGSKAQWVHLLKHGDAAAKKADPEKKWFETLQWAVVFLDDLEATDNIAQEIKEAFGVDKVHIVRGSTETLNFTTYDDGKLPDQTTVSIRNDANSPDESSENWVWINAPHATPYYYNYVGLMQSPMDSGAVKLGLKGKKTGEGSLQVTKRVKVPEIVA